MGKNLTLIFVSTIILVMLNIAFAFADDEFNAMDYLVSVEYDEIEDMWVTIYDLALVPSKFFDKGEEPQNLIGQNFSFGLMNAPLVNNLDVSVNFLYNNIYNEKILNFGQTLTIEAYVKNSTASAKSINLFAVLYDQDGKVNTIATTPGNIATNGAYQKISANLVLPSTGTTGYTAKAFVWDDTSLQPYVESINLNGTLQDYHSNSIDNANYVDYTKTINGRINTTSDIDFIKFIPATTGDYIIQTTGTTNTAGTLYNSSKASIATNNNISSTDTNFAIRHSLTANQVYYIEVNKEANSTGDYALTITPYARNINPTVVNGTVYVSGTVSATVGNSKSATVKLINSSNSVVSTQNVTTTSTGALSATFSTTLANGQYKIVVISDGKLRETADLKVLSSTTSFSPSNGEYCAVPFALTNVAALNNVEFSLSYAAADFEIYDVCDATQAIETGTGTISSGYLNVTGVTTTYVTFKSTRSVSGSWSGIANTVKLKAKRTATMNATSYVYQVK